MIETHAPPLAERLYRYVLHGSFGRHTGCLQFVIGMIGWAVLAAAYSVEVWLRILMGERYLRLGIFLIGNLLIFGFLIVREEWGPMWATGFWTTIGGGHEFTLDQSIAKYDDIKQFLTISFFIGIGHHVLARLNRLFDWKQMHSTYPGESLLLLPFRRWLPEYGYVLMRHFLDPLVVFVATWIVWGYFGNELFGRYLMWAGVFLAFKGFIAANFERHKRLNLADAGFDPITRERLRSMEPRTKRKGKRFVATVDPKLKGKK